MYKQKGDKKMKLQRLNLVLLALLLAAMAMVTVVSAADSVKNQTVTISGIPPEFKTSSHAIDYSKADRNLTREEFLSNNKEYIDYLARQIGRDAAIKIENDEYTRLITGDIKNKNALKMLAAVSPTAKQIWQADIFLWPYESKIKSLTDPDPSPMTFVVIGMSKYDLKDYLLNHNWGAAPGDAEYGYRGPSLSSMTWDFVGTTDSVQRGNPLTYRHHALVHLGGYSSSIGKYWSYGECHYEYSTSPGHHTIFTGGYDSGETQIHTTLSSSYGGIFSTYSNSLDNRMDPYWSGSGHIFYI
jgi:hypothetical protein